MNIALHSQNPEYIKLLQSKFESENYISYKFSNLDPAFNLNFACLNIVKQINNNLLLSINKHKNIVIDFSFIDKILIDNNIDNVFYTFLKIYLNTFNFIDIHVFNSIDDINPNILTVDSSVIKYDINKTFFADIKKILANKKKNLDKNLFYQNLYNTNSFGYYIGNTINPTKIFAIVGSSTNKITFDDYFGFLSEHPEYIADETISLVKEKHPANIFSQQYLKVASK